jgi:Putative zinc-finger
MTCREAIDLLGDFLAHDLGPRARARLMLHLAGCRPCRAYLRTYYAAARLGASAGRVEMPQEMKRRLRAFLIEHLSRERGERGRASDQR